MRKSAIIATCVVLVATLLSPGVAMAKGGNGQHSVASPKASGNGKAKGGNGTKSTATPKAPSNGKSTPHKSNPGKKPATVAGPKAASPQGTTAKNAEKVTRKAPRAKATAKAAKPQPATHEPPASAVLSTKTAPVSPASATFAEDPISSDTVGEAGIETRGVLDTIRVKVNASLEGLRATADRMWSTVTSWFGG